ncbi:MAG: hypothetical protein LDL41_01830 [Coleofasciculus sp. S288]|nr:hypothetical protein [Coleofasciculus sp. S288]
MSERRNFRFRFQPYVSTLDFGLLEYLKGMKQCNELVLQAVRAYWLPYALRDLGLKKGQALKKAVESSIFALESRIEQLRNDFGIESPRRVPDVNYLTSLVEKEASASDSDSDLMVSSPEMDKWTELAAVHVDTGGL